MKDHFLTQTDLLKSETGLTMMEVLIAISIFAVGVMGVAALQTNITLKDRVAFETTEATAFAEEQIESLLSMPFATLADGQDTVGVEVAPGINKYTRNWVVTPNSDGSAAIQLTISWKAVSSGSNRDRQLIFNYVRANV